MTVGEMLERMSSRELSEWMAYATLEPFGEERADLRAGIVASSVVNVHRGKGDKPIPPTEFMPKFWDEEPDDSPPEALPPEEIAAKLDALGWG